MIGESIDKGIKEGIDAYLSVKTNTPGAALIADVSRHLAEYEGFDDLPVLYADAKCSVPWVQREITIPRWLLWAMVGLLIAQCAVLLLVTFN